MEEQQTTTEAGQQQETLSRDDIKSAVTESLSETTKAIDDRVTGIENRLNPPKQEEDWQMPEDFYNLDPSEQKKVFDGAVNQRVSKIEKELKTAVEGAQMQSAKVYARQLVPSVTERAMKDIPDDLKPLAQKYLTDRLNQAAESSPGVFQDIPDAEIENISYQALGYAMRNKGSLPQDATPGGSQATEANNSKVKAIKDYWSKKTGGEEIPKEKLEAMLKTWGDD